MSKVIVITGASSGFGALTARALAAAGHRVYAGMRETSGRNAPQVANLTAFAKEHAYDLRWVEMDVASQESVEDAIKKILAENGRLDVVVHNAGHMVFGPAVQRCASQCSRQIEMASPAALLRIDPVRGLAFFGKDRGSLDDETRVLPLGG